jgi:archaellum component FlaF (FlaF/FlaG flagellin family)
MPSSTPWAAHYMYPAANSADVSIDNNPSPSVSQSATNVMAYSEHIKLLVKKQLLCPLIFASFADNATSKSF